MRNRQPPVWEPKGHNLQGPGKGEGGAFSRASTGHPGFRPLPPERGEQTSVALCYNSQRRVIHPF